MKSSPFKQTRTAEIPSPKETKNPFSLANDTDE
jgi:hypothetical protein